MTEGPTLSTPRRNGTSPGPRRRDRAVHSAFRIGVLVKGIDGVLELIGAAVPLFVRPERILGLVDALTRHELSEDPHDFLAHLLRAAGRLSSGGELFASIYLATHGVVKIVLVWALFQKKLWAYPAAMAVFAAFGVYQMYRWSFSRSGPMLALTVLDVFVILLTWAEYRRVRREAAVPAPGKRTPKNAGPARAPGSGPAGSA
ncbi:MAG TPA: DUF2127 domain-containing protein [Anaeromyxobacter sp.]|nr:DUF2127 domain-containing protein [Anaeromyxobacter sp.]